MRNIALQIAYQGTGFYGYQIQPAQITVQSCLIAALQKLLQQEPELICAGRTDTGVHAYAQLVNFLTEHALPLERFAPALNSLLPPAVQVIQAFELPLDFNARFAALGRHYRYVLSARGQRNPMLADQLWQCRYELDLNQLKQSWLSLQGKHNFKAFCASGSYRTQFEIPIYWSRCWQHGPLMVLDIMGQSFLRNMVRTLVGTCVDIARGHLAPERLQQALQTGERKLVGMTAPAQGLYLFNVIYPPEFALNLMQPALQSWPVPLADPDLYK